MKTQYCPVVSTAPSTRAAIRSRDGVCRKFPARALALAAALALLLPALPAAAENKADSSPVIHTTFNTTQVRNGPSQYPEYRNDEGDVLLTSVTTYHWNDGRGAEPGTIGVYEKSSGKCLGTWQASTRHNKTWWDAFPRILLEKGKTYYFVDSDQATWSYNAGSGNVGFIELCGLSGLAASSTAGMTTSGIAGPTPTPVKTTGIPGATPTPVKTTGRGELPAVPARRGSNGVTLSVDKTRFAPQEPIAVSYAGVTQALVDRWAWICVAVKDVEAANYMGGWQRPAVGNGSVTLAAPYEEGTYELRFFAGNNANEENLDRSTIITFTVERPELTKNVTLSVPKTVYAPEEAIDVAYTGVTQWLVDHYAWICVANKGAAATDYKGGWQRPALGNGTLTLAAPFDEGEYEVRFYSENDANTRNFEPRFTIPFSVRHSELTKDMTLSVPKTVFAPEEAIDVDYTGMTQWLVDHYAWICVAVKDAEASNYKGGWQRPKVGEGRVTLTAPFDEGEYELRFFDGNNANDLNFAKCFTIPFTVLHSELTKDVTLSVPKTLFAPEEAIDVDYSGMTEWLVGHYAWICMAVKDAEASNYKGGWKRPEAGDGRVTLTAPFDEGEYELRFFDGNNANDLNFVRCLTIPFTVLHSELTKDVTLSVPKTLFAPEEAIDVAYTGMTEWLVGHYAWICMAVKDAEASNYKGGWKRPEAGDGRVTLTAPFDEGEYELRFFDGNDANTLNFVTRLTIPFTVLHSELTKGVTLSVSKTRFAPGEEIAVGYTGVTQWLVDHYAWICVADRNAAVSDYKGGWKRPALGSGTVTLTAPSGEGEYELRFFDGNAANDLNFAKCFTIPFTVGPGPATPGVVVSAPPSGSVPPGGVVVSTPPTGSVPPGGVGSTPPAGSLPPGGVVVSTPPTGSVPPGGVSSTPPGGSVPPGGVGSMPPAGSVPPGGRDRDPVIYTTFNTTQVQNGPSHYPEYRNDEGNVLLTSVTTYHWNDGRGAEPGTIGVYEKSSGQCRGTWPASTRYNKTWWDAFPRILLEKGKTYYFVDSDQATWSYNTGSGNAGFIELCGFVNATGSSAGPGAVPPRTGAPLEGTSVHYDGGGATVGNLDTNLFQIQISEGSLPEGTQITVLPPDDGQLGPIADNGKFSEIVAPVDVSVEGYDNSIFGDDLWLTVPLPDISGPEELGRLVFCYQDPETGEIRTFEPSIIDTRAGTMSLELPHLSLWWGAKETEQQQVERFLDKHCTKMAVAKSKSKRLAAELEPYISAKAAALGLRNEAAKDFVQATINALGGAVSFSGEGGDTAGDVFGIAVNQATGITRAFYEGDADQAKSAVEDTINALTSQVWKEGKFSERAITNLFKSETIRELAPDGVDTLVSNTSGLAAVLGRIAGGDAEGAAEEVGKIMEGIHPAVSISTRGVRLLATEVNLQFTNWKSAQVEELYQVYKHGAKGLFGNYVDPGDRESFLQFLYTSSGFTKAKGVTRFYNMDKIEETCKRYGWSFKTYSEMPEHYRDLFEKRAVDGLMEYFETRREQEAEAEKLKAVEREVVAEMMNNSYGALVSGEHMAFFHEASPEDFNLTERLERLVKVREYLSQFVDEDALEYQRKLGGFNYGNVINWWVEMAEQYPKKQALELWMARLREYGLLKACFDREMDDLLDEMGAMEGEITASIFWSSTDDLDLHCNTPDGSHISYTDKSAGGGTLDVDMQVHGDRDRGVENIFFAAPEKGTYEFYVHNYKDRTDGDTPCRFRLKVGNKILLDETVLMGDRSRTWKIKYGGKGLAKEVEESTSGAP